jgi:hypothetical protein
MRRGAAPHVLVKQGSPKINHSANIDARELAIRTSHPDAVLMSRVGPAPGRNCHHVVAEVHKHVDGVPVP